MGWRDERKVKFNVIKITLLGVAFSSALLGTLLLLPPVFIALEGYRLCQEHCTQHSCLSDFIVGIATYVIVLPPFISGWVGLVLTYRDIKRWDKVHSSTVVLVVIIFSLIVSAFLVGLFVWSFILMAVGHYEAWYYEC